MHSEDHLELLPRFPVGHSLQKMTRRMEAQPFGDNVHTLEISFRAEWTEQIRKNEL